jgi:hypothetical protein
MNTKVTTTCKTTNNAFGKQAQSTGEQILILFLRYLLAVYTTFP